ncbi:MAG: ribokinase [Chitinophagaceae bacterium]|jgi:ribokinase|nr:ribokinase [Sphingobacteriales bacterium]OJW00297.1 MAG: ribokinase [Sphingobacteriales bacterium 44-61]TXJ28971.1 MAG: ribokinase [Chitinophagaceae bacterium]HEX2846867.1 ribokinase [Chitinophagaceae bacterium]
MKSGKIVVIGSSNMDMVVKTDHIPVPGETVLSGSFFMNPGGKGANQAVTVARLGGEVVFISKLGNDVFGKQFSQLFSDEGIDTSFILSDEDFPSGVALITVDKAGENSIVVASGANANLHSKDMQKALDEIAAASLVLLQLEIPMDVVHFAVNYAASKNVKVILNPAPANELSEELLKNIDILTPNKTEASMISGVDVTNIESAKKAAKAICSKGVKNVVVTMGPLGAVICQDGKFSVVAAQKVETVDTTAAGDVFNGALAVALCKGDSLEEAVGFACEAAALSVTRLGAQSSIPYRNELIARKLNIANIKESQ